MPSVPELEELPNIGPMKPWLCDLKDDDGFRESIILYGTDWRQIEADHPRIEVLGRFLGWVDL